LHDKNPLIGIFHLINDQYINERVAGKLDKKVNGLKTKAIIKRKCALNIVSPSKALHDFSEKKNLLKVKNYCIPNTIDFTVFKRIEDCNFKKRYQIPDENLVFLFIAEFATSQNKGFDLLQEALSKIKVKYTLIIVGSSEKQIENSGEDFRYLGSRNSTGELCILYSNSDAIIIPSREENLPNVMLESFACGTPVIAFPIGGHIDHIKEHLNGFLAKEISSGDLAIAINKFIENKEYFNSKKIRDYALDNFGENKIAELYKGAYSKLLSSR
jgi:glycosyltransferase involved in cell wall biosynthesis